MKTVAFALTFSVLGMALLAGCTSEEAGAPSEQPPIPGAGPGGVAPVDGGMGGGQPIQNPGQAGGTGGPGGAGRPTAVRSTFDLATNTIKARWGGAAGGVDPVTGQPAAAPAPGGPGGAKPSPIREGGRAASARKDPFESKFKPVVQIAPAWELVMNHRTAPMPKPPVLEGGTGDPNIDLPPLPPIPRRIAGVFYNGSITAIIESGSPPDSQITIVQPGAEVDSGIPGIPPLVVESITMDSIVLRAKDGRTVDVKLSGLSPAVQDALRQQFTTGGTGAGAGVGGPGAGPGGGGMSAPGGGAGGADLK